jgi:hypothetical protein
VLRRIWRVRSAATPMNTSGEAMISNPPEWLLPDPGFVVAEAVEVSRQFQIAFQGERGILV